MLVILCIARKGCIYRDTGRKEEVLNIRQATKRLIKGNLQILAEGERNTRVGADATLGSWYWWMIS
jgi:hypothetical protein